MQLFESATVIFATVPVVIFMCIKQTFFHS